VEENEALKITRTQRVQVCIWASCYQNLSNLAELKQKVNHLHISPQNQQVRERSSLEKRFSPL